MAVSFTQRCYALCRTIPRGRVTTYGEMARALGSPQASRAVGNAMRTNPDAPRTPCHRVVGSDGKLTGYAFGLDKKSALLEAEGVPVVNDRADLSKLHRFENS
ncbi:MAG: MGMT family protein [Planctomycetota bacterium]